MSSLSSFASAKTDAMAVLVGSADVYGFFPGALIAEPPLP